jgi:hypothetical protein
LIAGTRLAECHKQVARIKQPHTRGALAPQAPGFFLHWQENSETLPDNIAFGKPVAVWLELRQKSGCSELLNCHVRLKSFMFEQSCRSPIF